MKEIIFKTSVLIVLIAMSGCGGYQLKQNAVYWSAWNEGMGSSESLIPHAHFSTFQKLKHSAYAKDKYNAYYKGKIIEGADVASFNSLHTFFAADKNTGYYGGQPILDSDGNTFEYVEGNWSKDSKEYFYMTNPIGVCDIESFEITSVESNWWARDNKCIYYQKERVPIKDISSVKLLKGGYAIDKFGVYFGSSQVIGADPETFTTDGLLSAQDKNRCYFQDKVVDCTN